MLKEEFQLPEQTSLIKGKLAGDRMAFVSQSRGALNLDDYVDCASVSLQYLIFRCSAKPILKSCISQILLKYDPLDSRSINDRRYRHVCSGIKFCYIAVGVNFFIEWIWINSGDIAVSIVMKT